MKILNLMLLSLCSCSIFSQILEEEKLQDIQNNILVYQIRNTESTNYNDFIKKGYNILLKIDSIPNTFEIGNDKWKFFEIINNNFTLTNGKYEMTRTFTHSVPEYYKLSKVSLIATNEKKDLIFLGGNFFENSIADQYTLSINNIKSYFRLLKIKLYHYKLESIKFKRKNKKEIIFESFSNTLLRKIIIKVNRLNPDNLIIEN